MKELKKTCARCKKSKPVALFNKQQNNLDGLQAWCKECGSTYKEERRLKQLDKDNRIFNPNIPAF